MSGWGKRKQSEPEEEGIELTTFKVWGKHLSGGLGEEWVDDDDDYLESQHGSSEQENQEREQEKTLFSDFPRDFNTYRDSSTVGQRPGIKDKLQQIYDGKIYDRMIERARAMKQKMEQAGEPVDLDAIVVACFGHIPRGLVPPAFITELQSWRRVRDAMTARAVVAGQQPKSVTDKVKDGLDKAGIVNKLLQAGIKVIPGGKELKDIVEQLGDALENLGQVMKLASTNIDLGQGISEGSGPGKSPVELKIADEKVMEALKSLGGLGGDVLAKLLPVIGVLKNGAECLAALKDTMERVKLRAGTGDLKDQASLDTTSQLSRAFEQSQSREGRLGVESGLGAGTSAISTAAGTCTATIVLAKLGAAIEIVGTTISVAGKVVLTGYDEVKARAALATLKKAQGGDTDAQQAVFSDHAYYAKMLIALMAKDGNPLARKYLIDRGLEESDLDNQLTSADILFDYAVMKSKEEGGPESKIEMMKELAASALEKIERFGELCKSGLEWLGAIKKEPEQILQISAPVPPMETLAKMFDEMTRLKTLQEEFVKDHGAMDKDLDLQFVGLRDRLAKMQETSVTMREELSEQVKLSTGKIAEALTSSLQEWSAVCSAIAKRSVG